MSKQKSGPFGGKQVILVGELLQFHLASIDFHEGLFIFPKLNAELCINLNEDMTLSSSQPTKVRRL